MKIPQIKTAPLCASFCALSAFFLVGVTTLTANVTTEFNSPSDVSSRFDTIDSGAAGSIDYSTDAGIGGVAGRVNLADIGDASGKGLYTVGTVDPNEGGFTSSFFFLAEEYTTTTPSRIALGLSPDQTNLRANSEVQVRLIKNGATNGTFEVRDSKNDSGGDNINTTNVTLVDNHWYLFSVDFSNFASGSMNLDASITDYGTVGTVAGSVIATAKAGRAVPPDDFLDSGTRVPLYIGILAQNDGGGALALDNINMPNTAVIPESNNFALLASLSSLAFILIRRRS